MRKVFSKVFSSRVFYIVFSLLVAIALWMYVELAENPNLDHSVPGVEVVFVNHDLLRDRNFIISEKSPETVRLIFNDCPRSLIRRLNNSTVTVTVDVANIARTGYEWLPFEIDLPQGINRGMFSSITRSVEGITLSIDRLYERSFTVDARYTGGAAEGYIAGDVEISPPAIMIDGPESVVAQVSKVWIPINRESLSATLTEDFPFILLDENDEELSEELLEMLTFSQNTIRVTIPIRMMKIVALGVNLIDGAGATEQNSIISINPPNITVSGDPEDLMNLNTHFLGTIDLSRFTSIHTEMFTIALPNNLISESGESQAIVDVEVVGLETLVLSVSNPRVVNAPPDDYSVTVITQSHDVRLRGKAEDLENITSANIRVVADLLDLGPGQHQVPARVYIDEDAGDVGAIGDYRVTVRITREQT